MVGGLSGTAAQADDVALEGVLPAVVYHMLASPRNNAGFPAIGGFASDTEHDARMTADSDQDIAWVRPGREKSGTQKNIDRRQSRR